MVFVGPCTSNEFFKTEFSFVHNHFAIYVNTWVLDDAVNMRFTIPCSTGFAGLRKSCIQNWANNINNSEVIRVLAGHGDLKTTMKYYAQADKEQRERADILNRISPVRLERTTSGSGGQRSIQLSYGDTNQYHIYYTKTACKSRI